MSTPNAIAVEKEAIEYLSTPHLNPLFWQPSRIGAVSAWYGHIPFGHWLVAAARPRILVELGTHNGVSFASFCEAVVRNNLDTKCFAIDTWKGDEQTGFYDEEVFSNLRRFNDERYSSFSELLRTTFDEAASYFTERSIDVLHIDGLHTYEAVRHDFDTWLPKLSDKAVVLLHDTNVRKDDFGVWRLWDELSAEFPTFEFLHGYGLGVVAVGRDAPAEVLALCKTADSISIQAVRERFSALGQRCWLLATSRSHETSIAAIEERAKASEAAAAANEQRIQSLEAETARRLAFESQTKARAAQRTREARRELAEAIAQNVTGPALSSHARSSKLRVFYISGEWQTPGHFYRVVRPVEAAIAAGADASWIRADQIADHSNEIAAADVIVIWRAVWDDTIGSAVAIARSHGARVVFDVDDLMIDPDLARADVIDSIRSCGMREEDVKKFFERARTTMLAADICTTTTEELAKELRRFYRPALVLTNGFDHRNYLISRLAVRRKRSRGFDGLIRIGYAGGSRTHQRDFEMAADAIAQVLRERPQCRLVLFRDASGTVPILDLTEFRSFDGLHQLVEWHDFVPLHQLPEKMAFFDINIAPLEVGNVFCEAKSELKYFEAALVDVPTVASSTGPYCRAIKDGITGFLAAEPAEWYEKVMRLVDGPELRRQLAQAAHYDVLWRYGPLKLSDTVASVLPQLTGDPRTATRAFAYQLNRHKTAKLSAIQIPKTETVFEADQLRDSYLTVVLPLYNYQQYVLEALDSVKAQTLQPLDLIVVDDASTDESLSVAVNWAKQNAKRFNRLIVLRNKANSGLGPSRNAGIHAADSPFVLLLDADNRLLPECAATCLSAITNSGAAFAYPKIRQFGADSSILGEFCFEPARLVSGNYIDAMSIISKEAWAAVGGFGDFRLGWEDFDMWCRFVEHGFFGIQAGDAPLAEYRVHGASMLRKTTNAGSNTPRLVAAFEKRYSWLHILDRGPELQASTVKNSDSSAAFAKIFPLLCCPETGNPLEIDENGALRTKGSDLYWPFVGGRPNLFPGLDKPTVFSESHISNPLPTNALALIDELKDGWVLNLSAGGTSERFANVVEAEASVFRHTDVLVDAHRLPFRDGVFDSAIVMNAFEHYRDPKKVARELYRVLKPGGRLLVRTAFLQPLHEKPWHFYNCTRYGLEEWFRDFETEKLHVSENFSPGHSISWLASECEAALRREASETIADSFLDSRVKRFVSAWRSDEAARSKDEIWSALARLPQEAQESIAAGFEFIGRRPIE
jgi:glycosyltransferase involved in cell wall biosynthesis/SAM-dependent methyltransferase